MSYSQFCPIAKAAEIVAEKWSIIIIRELLAGANTFNDLKRGMPLISPTLLSKRLIELEDAKILEKVETGKAKPKYKYVPTESALELGPILIALGQWGNKWALPYLTKEDCDPRMLMWDIHRNIDLELFRPKQKYTVQFDYSGVPNNMSRWWVVIEKPEVDVCLKNPGHEVQLYIRTHAKTMTYIYMGLLKLSQAKAEKRIVFEGAPKDVKFFDKWFKLNPFANTNLKRKQKVVR